MTQLRKMMLDELQRRNYAQSTVEAYITALREFAAYFKRPPDQLGPEHIRQFQLYLIRDRKLATNTNQATDGRSPVFLRSNPQASVSSGGFSVSEKPPEIAGHP